VPQPLPAPTLVAAGVHKRIGQGRQSRPLLGPVELSLSPGEWLSVCGPSGVGKTTLLTLLSGCDVAYGGSIRFAGQELRQLGDTARARLRRSSFGFVFQGANLVGHLSALQNVLLPAYFAGGPTPQSRQRARDLLEELGLHHQADTGASQLSGGEQQRVALGRAILLRPDVLFCDEPTGALDPVTKAQVIGLLKRCQQAGSSLLVATHDPDVAAQGGTTLHLQPPETRP
jgi:ABC-type lipoprotein export system ATPase subunit